MKLDWKPVGNGRIRQRHDKRNCHYAHGGRVNKVDMLRDRSRDRVLESTNDLGVGVHISELVELRGKEGIGLLNGDLDLDNVSSWTVRRGGYSVC